MTWVGRYVGLPFHETDFNCWGLVRRVLAEQCQIEVPAYGEISAADLARAARAFAAGVVSATWRRVHVPQMFDVVLMHAMDKEHGRLIAHAGIMSSPRDVLHVWEATHAVNMAIDHPRVRSKIIGTYRHEALT